MIKDIETQQIELAKLETNKGQVEGIKKNPRNIRHEDFEKLKKSISERPDMLSLRELIVYPNGDKFVVICGNMRLRALRELKYKTAPCKVIPPEISKDDINAILILDNSQFGEWDYDLLANEWDYDLLDGWCIDIPNTDIGETDDESEEIKRMEEEFNRRMEAGEDLSEDEEYQAFLEKFKMKKTTDDCYTPKLVYDAVVEWVEKEYQVSRKTFVRPFYPNGDYQKEKYPKGCIVVDNPPFSILAEILQFYKEKGVRFFLFAPSLTLFSSSSSSSSTALCVGVAITYENGANVSTSFLTNLENRETRFRSAPTLFKAVEKANDEWSKSLHKELPKYTYPDNVVTSAFVARLSKYGIDFAVNVNQSCAISSLESQKESGKAIFGKGYLISEKAAAEKAAAEKAAAEKAAATRWKLSDKEHKIIEQLSKYDEP